MSLISDISVLIPRKDLTDEYRNSIQSICNKHSAPVIIGLDRSGRELWSLSRAINDAALHAKTPKLLICPGDYRLTDADIEAASKALDVNPWWGPFHSVYELTQESTDRVLNGEEPTLKMAGTMGGWCMPCTAVRADVFDDVGGFDPRFEGWGPEDAAFRHKLKVLYGEPEAATGHVFELAAPRSGRPKAEINGLLYCDRYLKATTPEEIRAIINEQIIS